VAGADAVLKYLARYVSGVALSDRRLVSHRNGRVTLRWKNYAHGGRSDTTTLEGVELVRRYMLHVLPPRFVRIRCYGLLSNRRRNTDLTRCLELLGAAPRAAAAAPAAVAQAPTDTAPARGDTSRCATCRRGRLVLLQSWPRPSVARLVARRSSLLGCTAAPHAAPRPEADRRSAAERSSAGRLRDTSSSRTGGLWPCATPLARRGTPPPSVRAAAGCPPAAT
jgi:hypothetical protein